MKSLTDRPSCLVVDYLCKKFSSFIAGDIDQKRKLNIKAEIIGVLMKKMEGNREAKKMANILSFLSSSEIFTGETIA